MDYSVKHLSPESAKTACLILGVYENNKLPVSTQLFDKSCNGQIISSTLKLGDMRGRIKQTLMLYNIEGTNAKRILLVGCGKANKINATEYQKICSSAASKLLSNKITEATSYLNEIAVKDNTEQQLIKYFILAAEAAQYRFVHFKSNESKTKKTPAIKFTLAFNDKKDLKNRQKIVKQAKAIALGINKTKDLANLPGNVCTPAYLAKETRKIQKSHPKVKVHVLSEAEMKKLGMGAFLSVSKGSHEPGHMITLKYLNGKKSKKPAVIIGKGITFDTGGISIKPRLNMDEMKYDMCGAASVIGTLLACAEMNLPINLIGIIACAENMPSGIASKPGDIVTTMSGQTVEILNTDAEGRLVLCDALTYAEQFNPASVIDIATLTGAVIIALGRIPNGLFSNHQALANDLIQAGETSNDKVWQLPIWDDYQDQLKSNFADMANIGNNDGASITAACFLARFAKNFNWAHLDVAGTAWKSGADKGATGRPLPLLIQYLIDRHAEKT